MALSSAQKSIVREIQALHRKRAPLNISAVKRSHPQLIKRVYAVRPYWGWKHALEDAGLDYKKINVELRDYVDCKICGRDFGALPFHLITQHDISPQDHAREYPDAELTSETARAKISHSHAGRHKRSASAHWEAIWTPEYALDRIAELHRRAFPLNFKWMAGHEKALTDQAIRYFGSWDEALRRIDLDPNRIRLSKPIGKPTTLRRRRRPAISRAQLRNRQDVMRALRRRVMAGKSLGSYCVLKEDARLYHAVRRHIGDFEEVYRLFRVWKPRESEWARADKAAIIAELRRRKVASQTLHSRKILYTKSGHAFLRRARTLFGSWTLALIAAGIQPPRGIKRAWVEPDKLAIAGIDLPRGMKTDWTKAGKGAVLAEIRRRKRAGELLRARHVRKERGGRAFVRRARTLFGSWNVALIAAGTEPEYGWSPWRQADEAAIVAELRRRQRAGQSLRIEKVQSEKWGRAFSKRARDVFGSWNAAVIAAGIEPARENSPWPRANRTALLAELRRRNRAGEALTTTVVQREKWGGAFNKRTVQLFGSWSAAILAAGVAPPRGLVGPWPGADRSAILREIRRRARTGAPLRSTEIATEQWGQALLRRAKMFFGSWKAALSAANVDAEAVVSQNRQFSGLRKYEISGKRC